MASLNSVKLGSGSLLTYFSSSSLSSKQLDQMGKRKHKTLAENVISFISQLGLQKSRQRVVPTPSKSCQPSVGVLPCVLSPCVRGTVEKLWRCNCIDQWSEMVCSLLNWNGVVRKNFWWNKQQGTKRNKKKLKMRKPIHPHRNPVDATLLPGIADGKGEQLGWLLQSSSCSTQQSIWDCKEMVMVLLKMKIC